MTDLAKFDYQLVVDTLVKLGNQLNKPSYRFLKGDVVAMAIEKATGGLLEYVDAEGYDSVDTVTGEKYELKSVANMFSAKGTIIGRVSLANTNKETFEKTFDYLLCIQSDPEKFAIAQLTWEECYANHDSISGQFNLKKGVQVQRWISHNQTKVRNLKPVTINLKQILRSVL